MAVFLTWSRPSMDLDDRKIPPFVRQECRIVPDSSVPRSGSPDLPEDGKGAFDPAGRPALFDQAVDPAGSRVGASIQRDDPLDVPSGKGQGIHDRVMGKELRSRNQKMLASEGLPVRKGSKGIG